MRAFEVPTDLFEVGVDVILEVVWSRVQDWNRFPGDILDRERQKRLYLGRMTV